MVLDKLLGRKRYKDDIGQAEYIEVDTDAIEGEQKKIAIRVEELSDYRDIEMIQKYVREGSIVLLKIKKLRSKDLGELKRSIEKIKKTCIAIGGDIVGVEEDWVIVTPNFGKVYRG